ncbi:MAG: NPCBM/NEW2 domain-containing protein [Pirellulales bacterium]|nr:NPCBM/NEW2 domain-containing protein [Pirellulales bacterium]
MLFLIKTVLLSAAVASGNHSVQYIGSELKDRIVYTHCGFGHVSLDAAVKPPRKPARKLIVGGKAYARGIGMHAPGEVVVDLDGEFARFDSAIGLQDGNDGSVVFQVYVDDEKKFDSGIVRRKDGLKKVTVDVRSGSELRLVVTDAGDGLRCDAANWVDVRLTPDPHGRKQGRISKVDVAPFATVVTSDPKRMQGTKAKRVEEFPAEDISFTKDLVAKDGVYAIPVDDEGNGVIGLEWREFRYLREAGLIFTDPIYVPENVEFQLWTGVSSWQGAWKAVAVEPRKRDGAWIWKLNFQQGRKATDKVRWVFRGVKSLPSKVAKLTARTRSIYRTADIRIEADSSLGKTPVSINIYNGEAVSRENPHRIRWNPVEPITFTVRYAKTNRCKTDQTTLRFKAKDTRFAVAVEPVVENGAMYIPRAGIMVSDVSKPVSFDAYKKKLSGNRRILDRIREMPEQTFEKAIEMVHRDIQDRGPTMLSLACDQRKFVAYRHGPVGFTLEDEPSAVFDGKTYRGQRRWPYQLHVVFGDEHYEKLSRQLEDETMPIPVTTVDEEGVKYSARTFVAPVENTPHAGRPAWHRRRCVCVAEYTVENTRDKAAETLMVLKVLRDSSLNGKQGSSGEKGKLIPMQDLKAVDGGFVAVRDGRLLAFIDTQSAGPLKISGDGEKVIAAGELRAGRKAKVCCYIPGWKVKVDDYVRFKETADEYAKKTKEYWRELMRNSARIEVPNRFLTNLIHASQIHIMLAAGNEEQGKRIDAWTSSDRYGALESESHPVIRGMDMMGHQDFARNALEFFIARYNDAGYLTTGYTMMGSGWHLWTMVEHVERSGGMEWFEKNAAEFARLCNWISAQRDKTKQIDSHGEKQPNWGVAPPGVFADWGRYTNTTFQEAQYCSGLRETARLLGKIGHADAGKLARAAAEYRDCIERSYRWTAARAPVVSQSDGMWAPAFPPILFVFGEVGGFFPGEDGSRAWCKNAMAHQLYVTGVFDPMAEEVEDMLDNMESLEFLRSGLGEPSYDEKFNRTSWFHLGGFNKCQPYYRRSVELYGLRDDVKPFIRAYFNTIPSLVSRENLTFWEHFHNAGGWNKTHETGWFLCQTRIMLVQERGDELRLAPFVTRNWLKDGMHIRAERLPTIFGPIGYVITSATKNGHIEASISPPTRTPPEKITIRLPHPREKRIKRVFVDGKTHADFNPEKETVMVVPRGKEIKVRAEYE